MYSSSAQVAPLDATGRVLADHGAAYMVWDGVSGGVRSFGQRTALSAEEPQTRVLPFRECRIGGDDANEQSHYSRLPPPPPPSCLAHSIPLRAIHAILIRPHLHLVCWDLGARGAQRLCALMKPWTNH